MEQFLSDRFSFLGIHPIVTLCILETLTVHQKQSLKMFHLDLIFI